MRRTTEPVGQARRCRPRVRRARPWHAGHDDWSPNDPERHVPRHHVEGGRPGTRCGPPSRSRGVRLQLVSDDTIVTDPATSLGIPWGFTVRPKPGDPARVTDYRASTAAYDVVGGGRDRAHRGGRAYAHFWPGAGPWSSSTTSEAPRRGTDRPPTGPERGRGDRRATEGTARPDVSDVATAEGGAAVVEAAVDSFGRVDTVINNAGNIRWGGLPEVDAANLKSHLAVHVGGLLPHHAGRLAPYGRAALRPDRAHHVERHVRACRQSRLRHSQSGGHRDVQQPRRWPAPRTASR